MQEETKTTTNENVVSIYKAVKRTAKNSTLKIIITPESFDLLGPKEQDVIILRYGLHDGKCRTLEEIGNLFGVTKERIRQIEADALRKLRHPHRAIRLRNYAGN